MPAEPDATLNYLGLEKKEEVAGIASEYLRQCTFIQGDHPRVKLTQVNLHLTIDGDIEVVVEKAVG